MKKIICMAFVAVMIVALGASMAQAERIIVANSKVAATQQVSNATQPEVTAAQLKALDEKFEAKYKSLNVQVNGKEGLNQRLKNVEGEFTSEDGAVVKAQSTADDAKGLAKNNGEEIVDLKAKVKRHEEWLTKLTAAYNKTAATVRGLVADAVTTSLLFIYGLAMIVIIIIAVTFIVWFFTRKKSA